MKVLSFKERIASFRASHWLYRWLVVPVAIVYPFILKALGGLGPEHFILSGSLLFFSLWNDWTRKWAKIVFPVLLYGGVYDSMRWYADYIRSPVIHLHEPHDFDVRFFGVHTAAGLVTPTEWLQSHTTRSLDFLCGLAYLSLCFVGESCLLALYLFGKGEEKRALRFIWIFVVTNFIGFSVYYIYPAAPPWYVADHGYVVDLTVRASGAGALRFDQIVGLPLMAGFYGKSADVFGAIPSLHVAYPFLCVVFGWHLKRFRPFAVAYFVLMCFSAMYLNHHYVLDMIVGVGIATLTIGIFRAVAGPLPAWRDEPARAGVEGPLAA